MNSVFFLIWWGVEWQAETAAWRIISFWVFPSVLLSCWILHSLKPLSRDDKLLGFGCSTFLLLYCKTLCSTVVAMHRTLNVRAVGGAPPACDDVTYWGFTFLRFLRPFLGDFMCAQTLMRVCSCCIVCVWEREMRQMAHSLTMIPLGICLIFQSSMTHRPEQQTSFTSNVK